MATPVTLKRMEEAKQKAVQRKAKLEQNSLNSLTNFSGYMKNYSKVYAPKDIDFTSDNAAGKQYTSFEKKKTYYNNNRQRQVYQKTIKLPFQEVINPPLGMGTDDYIIDSKNIICFNGKDHFLSNLSPSTILIDGHEYQSVEHYYQACKLYSLAGSEYALQLRNIDEPIRVKVAAKKILRSLNVNNEKIDDWKATQGFIMLNHAMVHKFVQNFELRKKLVETDDAILAHTYNRDSFYACGLDKEDVENWAIANEGKVIKIPSELTFENVKYVPLIGNGKNIVGAMCMKIRKLINELEREKQEITVEPFLTAVISSLKLNDEKSNA